MDFNYFQMRNLNRIKRIINLIKELIYLFPDKSLAEIIYYHIYKNYSADSPQLVLIEDDVVEEELTNSVKWFNEHGIGNKISEVRMTDNYKLKFIILEKIEKYWIKWHDLRFGQMIGAHLLNTYENYLFSISDTKFNELIDERFELFNFHP